MNKCCIGCGIELQNNNSKAIGYVDDLEKDYCERCFKLINYGKYESISNDNINYDKVFDDINKTNCLILLVMDILNITSDLSFIKKYIKNNWILVLNKRDLLPLSVKNEKIKKYFNNLKLDYLDIEIISTQKNYNLDNLMNKIYKYQNNKNVYVVGYTNAGKSSLISKIIKNYGIGESKLTISNLPSTTLDLIKIKINDNLTIIDTPGLTSMGNIINYVDYKMYKKLNSKKEIKPKTFTINKYESLIVDNILRINYLSDNSNSFTFYIPNEIDVKRISFKNDILNNLNKKRMEIAKKNDLVINGLGFIKIVSSCEIELLINEKIDVFTRNNLI